MANVYIQNAVWDKTTILRQSPLYSGIMHGNKFSPMPNNDYEWVLADGKPDHISKDIPRSRRVCFLMEYPIIWKPNPSYYDDIGIVVSPFNLDFPNHIRWIESHPAVGWFYGLPFRKDTGLSHYQSDKVRTCLKVLEDKKPSKKNNKISMIASSKGVTDGHKWRFQLAYAL